jgi:hypothetical protein
VVNFVVRAQRSVEGSATCKEGIPSRVKMPDLAREAAPDAAGRFVLRRVPAGRLTVAVTCPGLEFERTIDVPAEPGTLRGVRLSAAT